MARYQKGKQRRYYRTLQFLLNIRSTCQYYDRGCRSCPRKFPFSSLRSCGRFEKVMSNEAMEYLKYYTDPPSQMEAEAAQRCLPTCLFSSAHQNVLFLNYHN